MLSTVSEQIMEMASENITTYPHKVNVTAVESFTELVKDFINDILLMFFVSLFKLVFLFLILFKAIEPII